MVLWRRGGVSEQGLAVRPLEGTDRDAALALCLADPVGSVLAGVHVEALGGPGRPLPILGVESAGRLVAVCWSGANMVPVARDPHALAALAEAQRRRGRRCSSIVGPAEQVLPLWDLLSPWWAPPREVRADQPSMTIIREPAVLGDPRVRRSRPEDFDVLFPACVAMFTEEVGYSPVGAGSAYESRVRELIQTGRSFVRIDDGPDGPRVVFKAELGAVALGVAQVQGVWVDPGLRGRGLAQAGMAAVVRATLAEVAPTVSLYVNAYNAPALRAYRRVGFEQVGTYATVLF
jgi:predicted GNAT family acetyltransferase